MALASRRIQCPVGRCGRSAGGSQDKIDSLRDGNARADRRDHETPTKAKEEEEAEEEEEEEGFWPRPRSRHEFDTAVS